MSIDGHLVLFIVHLALAIFLFCLMNWIGARQYALSLGYTSLSMLAKADEAPAFNFVFRAFAPTVYLILIASGFYFVGLDELTNSIWLVVIYYFAFRAIYNLIFGRAGLVNWKAQIIIWLVSIPISYVVYDQIIKTRENLVPDFSTIANELWIVVLLFLYATFNNLNTSLEGSEAQKKAYLNRAYRKYKSRFSRLVEPKVKDKNVEALVYSIMTYESFNRPRLARLLENALFPRISKTLGIMQITTDRRISDEESVELGVEKIVSDYSEARNRADEDPPGLSGKDPSRLPESFVTYSAIGETIASYNGGDKYLSEVLEIYGKIKGEFYSS